MILGGVECQTRSLNICIFLFYHQVYKFWPCARKCYSFSSTLSEVYVKLFKPFFPLLEKTRKRQGRHRTYSSLKIFATKRFEIIICIRDNNIVITKPSKAYCYYEEFNAVVIHYISNNIIDDVLKTFHTHYISILS